jgi:hypothetical protein
MLLNTDDLAKFQRFRINLSNPNARQCPKCDHTIMGDLAHPAMTCPQWVVCRRCMDGE